MMQFASILKQQNPKTLMIIFLVMVSVYLIYQQSNHRQNAALWGDSNDQWVLYDPNRKWDAWKATVGPQAERLRFGLDTAAKLGGGLYKDKQWRYKDDRSNEDDHVTDENDQWIQDAEATCFALRENPTVCKGLQWTRAFHPDKSGNLNCPVDANKRFNQYTESCSLPPPGGYKGKMDAADKQRLNDFVV